MKVTAGVNICHSGILCFSSCIIISCYTMTRVLTKYSNALDKINQSGALATESGRRFAAILNFIAQSLEALVENFSSIATFIGITLGGRLMIKAITGVSGLAKAFTGATIAQKLFNVAARLNPYVIIALGAAAAITAVIAFGKKTEIVGGTVKELSSQIQEAEKDIRMFEARLRALKPGPGFGGGSEGDIFFNKRAIKEREELIRKLQFAMSKLQKKAEETRISMKNFAEDPAITMLNRKLGLQLVEADLDSINQKILTIAKTFGDVKFEGGTFTGIGEIGFFAEEGKDITPAQKQLLEQIASGKLRSQLQSIDNIKFLNFAFFRDSLAGIQAATKDFRIEAVRLEDQLELLEKQIQRDGVATKEQATAWASLKRQMKELNDAIPNQKIERMNRDMENTTRIADEVRAAYDPIVAGLREYNKELAIAQGALDRTDITQDEFNKKLVLMQIELANSVSAFRFMGETIASAFAAGIVAGDKMSEVLHNIGRQLVQAALKALILRSIMASFGAGIVGTENTGTENTGFAHQSPGEPFLPNGRSTQGGLTVTGTTAPRLTTSSARTDQSATIINVDARGAEPGAEARVEQAIRTMGDQAVRQAVAITTERRLRS